MKAIQIKNNEGKIYELGGSKQLSFREFIELVLKIINKKRLIFNMPMKLAKFQSQILEALPMKPILTKDQCLILQEADNIVSGNFLTIQDLGIKPTDIESVMPNWLWRYRKGAFKEFSKT